MSIGYYTYKIQEIVNTLSHIRAYFEHEDLETPSLKDAIESLHRAVTEIREAEEYKKEREEIYERESNERESKERDDLNG